jgi:hypothetical protein
MSEQWQLNMKEGKVYEWVTTLKRTGYFAFHIERDRNLNTGGVRTSNLTINTLITS